MKSNKIDIVSRLKHLIAAAILIIVFIQPIIQSIALYIDNNFEIAQIDAEEDGEEKENQKKDNKEDEKQLSSILYYHHTFVSKKLNAYMFLKPTLSFNKKIPIPPPDKTV